jgi:triacylglycerol lipase
VSPTFDISQTGFSLGNAKACAEASRLAYVNPATIQNDLNHVLVLESEQARVIAFRGTASARDFLTDADFIQSPLIGKQKVHRGFLAAFNTVTERLWSIATGGPYKPLFITGHSLGGAQASLCAHLLETRGVPIHSVYTFGKPRVGNRAYATAYNANLYGKSFRFVNSEDVVPRVPWLCGRYWHEGQLVFLPSMGGYRLNASLLEMALSDAYGFWKAYASRNVLAATELVKDHGINEYISALTGQREAEDSPMGAEALLS